VVLVFDASQAVQPSDREFILILVVYPRRHLAAVSIIKVANFFVGPLGVKNHFCKMEIACALVSQTKAIFRIRAILTFFNCARVTCAERCCAEVRKL